MKIQDLSGTTKYLKYLFRNVFFHNPGIFKAQTKKINILHPFQLSVTQVNKNLFQDILLLYHIIYKPPLTKIKDKCDFRKQDIL